MTKPVKKKEKSISTLKMVKHVTRKSTGLNVVARVHELLTSFSHMTMGLHMFSV